MGNESNDTSPPLPPLDAGTTHDDSYHRPAYIDRQAAQSRPLSPHPTMSSLSGASLGTIAIALIACLLFAAVVGVFGTGRGILATTASTPTSSSAGVGGALPGGPSAPSVSASPTTMPLNTPIISPTATVLPATTAQPAVPVLASYPYVGGPYSNFVTAYGQPVSFGTGNSANFLADQKQEIVVNVDPPVNGVVDHIGVTGPTSWSNDDSYSYCSQFLPPDAVRFNTDSPYTDFKSVVGTVVLANFGQGACLVYLAEK